MIACFLGLTLIAVPFPPASAMSTNIASRQNMARCFLTSLKKLSGTSFQTSRKVAKRASVPLKEENLLRKYEICDIFGDFSIHKVHCLLKLVISEFCF